MPQASIVIVTRNRREVAERAVASALAQQADVEVLVIDDASTDGTVDYLRGKFTDSRLRVHAASERKGYIVQRNLAARMATSPVVFSIDDDAEFVDGAVVGEILRLFDHPRVGAVLIPFHNCAPGEAGQLMTVVAPDDGGVYVTNTFIGTAYAVRRDVFLALGGFQELLYHWGEETEYSQRLLNAGYVVGVGTRPAIRHYPGMVAGKYSRKVNRYISRNRLLTVWFDAPRVYLLPLWLVQHAVLARQLLRRPSELLATAEGAFMAYGSVITAFGKRKPLPRQVFKLWLRLRERKMLEFDQIRDQLPPARETREGQLVHKT
jgi:glycosyltransferase involved in cell wall biosynthesis